VAGQTPASLAIEALIQDKFYDSALDALFFFVVFLSHLFHLMA